MPLIERPRTTLTHWRAALGHPAVKAPLVLSLIMYGGLLLSRRLTPVFAIATLFLLASFAAWSFVATRLARLSPDRTARTARARDSRYSPLIAELTKLFSVEGVEDTARQAVRQLGLLETKLEILKSTLSGLLSPSEITYQRYIAAAEQVAVAIVAQGESAARHGLAAQMIDADYAKKQLARLALTSTAQANEERQALTERLALREQSVAEARALVSKNESALTALAKLSVALEGFAPRSSEGAAKADALDPYVKDLEELAQRVKLYQPS